MDSLTDYSEKRNPQEDFVIEKQSSETAQEPCNSFHYQGLRNQELWHIDFQCRDMHIYSRDWKSGQNCKKEVHNYSAALNIWNWIQVVLGNNFVYQQLLIPYI